MPTGGTVLLFIPSNWNLTPARVFSERVMEQAPAVLGPFYKRVFK